VTDDCTALPLTLFFFMALITASIGTPHTVFDASLNRTITLFFKAKAGTDVALAGRFELLARFVSPQQPRRAWTDNKGSDGGNTLRAADLVPICCASTTVRIF
jgi:hypothetical protein